MDSLLESNIFQDFGPNGLLSRYLAMASIGDDNNWYGGTLIYDEDESSEAYKHYAELCQVIILILSCP